MLINYLKFNFLFFCFHLITWNLIIKNFNLSSSLLFFIQYALFCFLARNFFDNYIVVTSLPLQILYLITVIQFIDRSITVQLFLEYYSNPNNIDLVNIMKNDFFDSSNLVQKRIDEHLSTNILIGDDNKTYLSNIGKLIINFYHFLAEIYK